MTDGLLRSIGLSSALAAACLLGGCAAAPPPVAAMPAAGPPEPPPDMLEMSPRRADLHRRCTELEEKILDGSLAAVAPDLAALREELRRRPGIDEGPEGWKDEFRPRVLFWLGFACRRTGDREEAVQAFDEIIRGFPGTLWARQAQTELESMPPP